MYASGFTAFILVAASIASVRGAPAPVTPCAQVHIIAARASTEAPGAGIIGDLVSAVQSRSSQTVSTSSVNYPASLTDYANSSAQGTSALKSLLTSQANSCPNQKIVLVGYSQGAHIIGDVLAGGGGGTSLGPQTPPIDAAIANRVTAVVQMGDPRFIAFKAWDEGTSITNGLFPRLSSQVFPTAIQARMQSYCDINDLFCASGLSTTVHLTYLSRYQTTARDFIVTQIGG